MGLSQEHWSNAALDYKDRDQPGLVIDLELVSYKRLDDGRWYVRVLAISAWIRDDHSDLMEIGYQAGLNAGR